MKGWLLDTNVIAELLRPRPEPAVERWARRQSRQRMYISVLVVAEIEQGLWALPTTDSRRPGIELWLRQVRRTFAGRILGLDDAVVGSWARIRGLARRTARRTPPPIDTFLAATAIEHGLYLASRNVADFDLTGATLFNPWKDDAADFPLR